MEAVGIVRGAAGALQAPAGHIQARERQMELFRHSPLPPTYHIRQRPPSHRT